jgi:CubicO group peptidase (beta-lactamase class C family)
MKLPNSMAIVFAGSVLAGCAAFASCAAAPADAAAGTAEKVMSDDGCCGLRSGRSSSRNVNGDRHRARFVAGIRNLNTNVSDARRRCEDDPTGAITAPLPTSPAPPGDPTATAMQTYLQGLAANGFTGSVLIVRRGQVLARFAAGEADEENHVPVRPDTVFRLASVTKQFTAMLVLKLLSCGVHLDDPVCPYLIPRFIKACPESWLPITLRQTVTHTSGIPDIQGLPDFFAELSQPTTTQRLIQRFIDLPLDFPPGTSWKYTNSGFILAGAIIETVTHKPYGAVLHDEIAGPLNLWHTGYSRGNPPPGYAKGYFTLGSPAPPTNGSQAFSATGIYSTTDDIARWDRSFGAYLVAPPATVKKAFTPQAPCPPGGCLHLPSSAYAFGWMLDRLNGHRLIYHPGLLQGYAASNMYLPYDDIEVVVLSNVEDTDTNGIARHLATMAVES